jgi:hypothetical protein
MKNKPDTNICYLTLNQKKRMLILVNLENFYFKLTSILVLRDEIIDKISVLLSRSIGKRVEFCS